MFAFPPHSCVGTWSPVCVWWAAFRWWWGPEGTALMMGLVPLGKRPRKDPSRFRHEATASRRKRSLLGHWICRCPDPGPLVSETVGSKCLSLKATQSGCFVTAAQADWVVRQIPFTTRCSFSNHWFITCIFINGHSATDEEGVEYLTWICTAPSKNKHSCSSIDAPSAYLLGFCLFFNFHFTKAHIHSL